MKRAVSPAVGVRGRDAIIRGRLCAPAQERIFLNEIKHLRAPDLEGLARAPRPADSAHAPQPDQALRASSPSLNPPPSSCPGSAWAWWGPTAAARATSWMPCAGCSARARRANCVAKACRTSSSTAAGHRKPASRASVELVFRQRRLARAGGQWNQLHRDCRQAGADARRHQQLLHQQPARAPPRRAGRLSRHRPGAARLRHHRPGHHQPHHRKSRPEELRLFLEEAAGVSKYKERRRETENRLKDTRENLTRVDDILRELGGNLEKLEKQAEVATPATGGLQEQGTLTKLHQLWFLKHRDAAQRRSSASSTASALKPRPTRWKARMADLRAVVSCSLKQVRQAHYAANDVLHAQARCALGEAALDVSRLEERIRYVVEGRQRAQQRLADLKAQNSAVARPSSETAAEERAGRHRRRRSKAADEQAGRAWPRRPKSRVSQLPQRWKTPCAAAQAHGEPAAPEPWPRCSSRSRCWPLKAAASKNSHASLRTRRERLASRAPGPAGARHGQDRLRCACSEQPRPLRAQTQETAGGAPARAAGPEVPAAGRAAPRRAGGGEQPNRVKLADIGAPVWRRLRALQEKVQTEGKLKPWLDKHGLDGPGRACGRRCTSRAGWETALEAALRERLNALAVGRLDTVRAFATDAPPAQAWPFMRCPTAATASTATRRCRSCPTSC